MPTLILRGLSAVIGLALALALVFLDGREKMPWSELGFAIGGVCFLLGFGLGGDVWGARVFRWFWHFDPNRTVETHAKPGVPPNGGLPDGPAIRESPKARHRRANR